MCAQCNNKKLHVHAVKAVGVGQPSVVVENNRVESCCSTGTCQSNTISSVSQESDLSPGDDDPASGASLGFSVNKITSAEVAAESSCCSSGSCSDTASEDTPSDDVSSVPHSTTLSWKVGGMDCPSCASKLEKAINGLMVLLQRK